MAIIKKKILPEYFEAILSGNKRYELRLNDFDANEGDTLVLEEWTDITSTRLFTGRIIEKRITRVERFKVSELYWTEDEIKEKGLQILSFE